jgi:hypothetical protein
MKKLFAVIVRLYFRLSFVRQALWSMLVFAIFLLVAVLFFSSDRVATRTVGWEKTQLVSSYRINAMNVSVASRGNFIVAAYEASGEGGSGIYVSISFNGGSSFIPPALIARSVSTSEKKPSVAIAASGALAVAWHDYVSAETANRIFIAFSPDMGATWQTPSRLNLGMVMEIIPRVYYDDKDRLHLFYHGLSSGNFNLHHSMVASGGLAETTGSLVNLRDYMKGAFFPAINFSGSTIFVVLQARGREFKDDLFFIMSSNYGRSWSRMKKITSGVGGNVSPSLVRHRDNLYVAYQNNDERAWSIKLLTGKKLGSEWDERPLTVSDTPANCYNPRLVEMDNELYISWHDERERISQIYSRVFKPSDGPGPGSEAVRENNPARYTSLLQSGGKVIAFWEESGRVLAKYTDEFVHPPVVYSATHPEDRWSRNSTAVIEWTPPEDESGIAGYVTVVNRLPDFNPPDIVNTKSNATRKVLTDLEDGVNYFHIRAIDGAGNVSRTVHYPLRVSSNPPPMPLVFSPTHKEGVDTQSSSPVFRWAVDDAERLKGFYYTVSRGGIAAPDQFTTAFEARFDDMEQGGYFFSVSSVDKTNQVSPMASYYFIVGRAEKIDIDKIKAIARQSTIPEKRIVLTEPRLEILFPFNAAEPYTAAAFSVRIRVSHIPMNQVEGFSVFRGDVKGPVPETVAFAGPEIPVADLADGSYYLGVRCRYFRMVDGRKKYFWSRPAYASFMVSLPGDADPFQHFITAFLRKVAGNAWQVSVMVLALSLITLVFGFGARVAFYARLVRFKFVTLFRVIVG